MSGERRYNDAEIAEIFRQAAEAQEAAQRQLGHGEGLTLAELQEIGQEAGITPAFIARAAAGVARTARVAPPKTLLGLPITASHTIDLPGPLTEAAWDRLVVDLRETFHATGKVRREGSLREWRNGNLRALVEPTEDGHRLYLRTLKGNAQRNVFAGATACVVGLSILLAEAVVGDLAMVREVLMMALFIVAGLGSVGWTAYHLPRWADERSRQMAGIAERAAARAARADARAAGRPTVEPLLERDEDGVAPRVAGPRSDRLRS